jgi:hypothetical protein
LEKAYSLLEVKSADGERRIITGIATTPTPDRASDVVESLGVRAAPNIPLLLHHDVQQIVGRATFGSPTATGVPFEATLPKIAEAGRLRDRIEEAWQLISYRLLTGISIGFRPIADRVERLKTGGLRYLECEVVELTLCPIPMNAEATILTVRSLDLAIRSAPPRPVQYVTPALLEKIFDEFGRMVIVPLDGKQQEHEDRNKEHSEMLENLALIAERFPSRIDALERRLAQLERK